MLNKSTFFRYKLFWHFTFEICGLNQQEIMLLLIQLHEQKHFQYLMQAHHYPGSLPMIGHTLWYVASYHNKWPALISFSAAVWKCAVRDQWIGWSFRYQYDRYTELLTIVVFWFCLSIILQNLALVFFLYVNVEFLKICFAIWPRYRVFLLWINWWIYPASSILDADLIVTLL